MKIDTNKLKNVSRKTDGKITAQCPACAADGGDAKGEHLAVFPDGKFGCVVHEKDKAHNRAILKLAGVNDRGDGGFGCRLTVKPFHVVESTVLMTVGRLGRVKSSVEPAPPRDQAVLDPPGVAEAGPERPESSAAAAAAAENMSPEITDEKLREFLDLPALAA